MAEKSVVSDETEMDGAADPVVAVVALVAGVVVFFDELHAARPAAVMTATDHMETRFADSFILPPPVGLNNKDGREANVNKG
jgi:hypothetical protein